MIVCPQLQRAKRAWTKSRQAGALVAILLAFVRPEAHGQTLTNVNIPAQSAEFAIESWRTDEGLPQNTATAVIQTRRGYIWAGTYNGIAQFDGIRFQVFDSSNTKGLANSRITSLHEDAAGAVWIGHDAGEVSRFVEGEFTTIPHPDEWGRTPIKDFAEDELGDVWALNQLGMALRLRDGRIVKPAGLMAENPFVNPCVAMDARARAYVVRNGVVARFTSDGYAVMNFGDPAERPYYDGIASARDGSVWVVGEGKVRKWGGTNWAADVGTFPWTGLTVTLMHETTAGRLLLGTLQNGLLAFDPATGWFNLNRTNGLPQDWVCSLVEDREDNLWVGTHGGLALLRERKVRMQNPPDDWQGRPVLSIMRAHDGAVWAATEGAGVYRFKDGGWSHFGLGNLFVWSVFEDSQNQIWAGTWGGGLFRLEQGSFVMQTNLIAAADPVVALKESPAGTLWIGTGAGLVRMQSNVVERFAHLGGAAAGDVRVIEEGAHGELWLGTQGSGLGRFKDGQCQTFRTIDGLAGNFIISLCCETNGTLWIGTLDMGLCRFKDGRFSSITPAQGLLGNIIYHIEDDHLGNLWFNSPKGLFRVSKQQLNACADGKLPRLEPLSYGRAEGMTTLAGTGGFTPSGFRAPDEHLWFSTARGIAVVEPESAHPNPVRPPVWIEEVFVEGQSLSMSRESAARSSRARSPGLVVPRNRVTLQPGRRQLDVQFTALSFTAPERVRFKYQLEGLDPGWVEAGTRRRVTYPFLPPGNYTFRVTACNNDGLWSETGDALAIEVQPYFWQTWWFNPFLAILGAVVLALIFFLESRRRVRRKLERIARERELEHERARIAQDIHDDLGASLTRIGMLSQSAAGDLSDPPRATANLNLIYDTTRELTRAMDEIVWAVNPRHDTLESLTNYISRFAQDFLETAQIRCRLAMPLQVPEASVRSEVRHNLFLAFKEALNNAVKHSRANEVRITLQFVRGGFTLGVADNGVGFDQQRVSGGVHPAGNGLRNLRSRLAQVGGHSQIHSAPGEGTRIEFFVPQPNVGGGRAPG